MIERRSLLAGSLVLAATPAEAAPGVYGRIGRMDAKPGERDALIAILLEGSGAMPGCLSYVVAEDVAYPDAVWITELWDSETSHAASLALPRVRAAIARARPLIAGADRPVVTRPVGGQGLPR